MKLPKIEKMLLLSCPWFFGMVLIVSGIVTALTKTEQFLTLLLVCSGLTCISIYCVCVLLMKIIEK